METNCVVKLDRLRRTDLRPAALILGRAMRDNPVHVRAFAISNAERRGQALERFFRPVLRGLHERGLIYGAYRDNALVGICGIARPGFCQPTPLEKLRLLPAIVFGNPLGTALRVLNWTDAWAHRDPAEPHWHLGPVAIEPCVQRQGIGSALLTAFCVHLDAYGAVAYLETDRRANVHFYQKFGFTVVAEADVMGVPNWFMSRPGPTAKVASRSHRLQTTIPYANLHGFPGFFASVVLRRLRLRDSISLSVYLSDPAVKPYPTPASTLRPRNLLPV
jgi:ribosomal protein S18 acetylase RimI-like enzyme